jgi:hypothetical protein
MIDLSDAAHGAKQPQAPSGKPVGLSTLEVAQISKSPAGPVERDVHDT